MTDGVGTSVGVSLGAGVAELAAATVVVETGVTAALGLAIGEDLGVALRRGVRVRVGGSAVSGAAHAVNASVMPAMTESKINRLCLGIGNT